MHRPQAIFLILALTAGLYGCKLTVTSPRHGHVESTSGAFTCTATEPCVIDIEDTSFEESFVAVPDEGFQFVKWRKAPSFFCGDLSGECRISTGALAGNPDLEAWLELDIEIFLEPVFASVHASAQHTIMPEGGTYEFLTGAVIEVPAGAVDEPTPVTVTEVPESEVEPILSFHTGAVTGKRFLGGISVTPDVEFNEPVFVTLPITALEPYENLMHVEIEREEGKYWFEKTNIDYLPETQQVRTEVTHFSTIGEAAMEGLDGETLHLLCTDPDLNNNAICEAMDKLQPAACLLKRKDRPPGTDCCREGAFTARSEALDFISSRGSKTCEMLSSLIEITYHECRLPDGSIPTELDDICELSVNCPQEVVLGAEVTITPPQTACFAKGDTLALEATVVDGNGNELPSTGVQWRSADDGIATVNPDGVLTAKKAGDAIVEAKYRHFCKDFADNTGISIMDLSGTWSVVETADERNCDEGINTYRATINITQSGSAVSIAVPGLSISGTRAGCSMQLSGGGAEDQGRTFGSGRATIDPSGNSIQASGSWTWTGIDPATGRRESCTGNSTYTVTR
jgi:hypothetical protein